MAKPGSRVFKTSWFTRRARAAEISDTDLCKAASELEIGQGSNLGGNVWKKRLDRNTQRGIVVNRIGDFWVFVYLFAKSDRENIDDSELRGFKTLARDYGNTKPADLERRLALNQLMEICNEQDPFQKRCNGSDSQRSFRPVSRKGNRQKNDA